jgi:outer membrane protein TolC
MQGPHTHTPRSWKLISIFLLLTCLTTGQAQISPRKLESNSYIQRQSSYDEVSETKNLRLNAVVEQGLRKNYDQTLRGMADEILDLDWKDSYQKFWYPEFKLSMTTTSQRIGRLRQGSKGSSGIGTSPTGTLGLELGDYTLFNWGKDYLDYLSTKTTFKRSKSFLEELRRNLKHDLIIKFFSLKKVKEIEKIKKDQLRNSSFIYRLAKEKVSLRKITRQEFYLAREEYLRSQQEYFEAKKDAGLADEEMAFSLTDPPGTRYLLVENLKFKKVQTTYTEAIKISELRNSEVLNAQNALKVAHNDYELSVKENLPLPKFTMNFGAYNYNFSKNINNTEYETSPGSSDLEIVASVNATWSINGPGGFFNSRTNRKSLIKRNIAERNVRKFSHSAKSKIRDLYRKISNSESQVEILKTRKLNLQQIFDIMLEKYINKKARLLDLREIRQDLTESEVLYENEKFNHLQNKILLAQTMGLGDFPGENFENLAELEK